VSELEQEAQDPQVETPTAEAPAEETPEAQPEQEFDPRQAYEELASRFDDLPNIVQQSLMSLAQQSQQQPEEDLPDLDPYDPESVIRYIEARDQRRDQELKGMLGPLVEQHEAQQAEQFINSAFDKLNVPADPIEGLEFSERDATLMLSAGFRYQGLEPAQALAEAHKMLRQYGEAMKKAGRSGQVQELETLRGATQQPPAAGAAGVQQVRKPVRSLEERALQIAAERGFLSR